MSSENVIPIPPISSPTAYFLDGAHRRRPSSLPSAASRDDEEIDNLPNGATSSAEFNSRPVSNNIINSGANDDGFKRLTMGMRPPSMGVDWLSYISRNKDVQSAPRGEDFVAESGEIGTLIIPRKVPIKVEPKVHFANER